ncbi:hypothetical protein ZTR_06998 [Talaromyces verruculosus]|nr:hypothetical protein ZTR_06998 [Talaromyces verruculosus]
MDDEDGPPELVEVTAFPESLNLDNKEKVEEREKETGELISRVPITLVTGYLGAGKTTLLNYILTEKHGKKIAVIMNEFGDSTDIEKSLTVNQNGQEVTEWLDVGNGCICCSVKDSGVQAIESLMDRRGTFDYILLETTGLADPGNIAPLFWVDDGLGSSIYLDGIVTLVDAKNILRLLDEPAPNETTATHAGAEHDEHHGAGPALTMAHLQISHADVIVLNKADLVTPAELEATRQRIASINGAAKIHVTDHSRTPQIEGVVLDLHAYDQLSKMDFSEKGHAHIDPRISTVALTHPRISPNQLPRLDEWLRSILWKSVVKYSGGGVADDNAQKSEFEIHRLKGILALTDGTFKIIQAVREMYEIRDSEKRESKDDETEVFYQTPLTFALVNLKPIIPGHVLVSPRRIVPRVSDLTADETTDLFLTVRKVGRMIERVYGATSLNIAIQDGVDAGQSVPHVHTHIIPRKRADLDHKGGTDAIYGMLDGEEGDLGRIQRELQLQKDTDVLQESSTGTILAEGKRRSNFPAVDNESRTPRSGEDMEREAVMLAAEMEKEDDRVRL